MSNSQPQGRMGKGRLEAFSDGVLAIVITIMVLELKAPQRAELDALRPLFPAFVGYLLSFIYVGIYWNNHHHIFQVVEHVSGMTLWANLHLLFWISLIPFVTRWMGDTDFGTWPVAAYGIVLLMCAVSWEIVRRVLLAQHDRESTLVRALSSNGKELLSLALYVLAIGLAFLSTLLACLLYVAVALLWMIPDRRIERQVELSH